MKIAYTFDEIPIDPMSVQGLYDGNYYTGKAFDLDEYVKESMKDKTVYRLRTNVPTIEETDAMDIVGKYVKNMGYVKAVLVDTSMSLVIKQKPRWLPTWLYKKVIRDVIELVTIKK